MERVCYGDVAPESKTEEEKVNDKLKDLDFDYTRETLVKNLGIDYKGEIV